MCFSDSLAPQPAPQPAAAPAPVKTIAPMVSPEDAAMGGKTGSTSTAAQRLATTRSALRLDLGGTSASNTGLSLPS